jgi:hypothetical protein
MDLDRMLEKCRSLQWSADDLDWSQSPRTMSADDEEAIVQYFTDMAGIERLAGALFAEQERRVEDPRLKEIFRTFVVDEERHAVVADRLARFYDVRKLRTYAVSESLSRFRPHFMNAVRHLSDEIANTYILGGELILDVALLRSLDDYVHDGMSAAAMRLINRDESRHIAIDYHMVEFYASDDYTRKVETRPKKTLRERAVGLWTLGNMLYFAAPFFREVFFQPMERVDPSGRRLREAFKRMQLLRAKPGVTERPFGKFMNGLQDIYDHPVGRLFLGRVVARLAGVDPRFMASMNSEAEMRRASTLSFDDLAEEALAAKFVS